MSDEMDESEFWRAHREQGRERKRWHQQNTTPRDKKLLKAIKEFSILKIEDDGSGGEKYVIVVSLDKGPRKVEWWTATGKWRVRGGKAEGRGIYSLARYFQLVPRDGKFAGDEPRR